MAAPIKVDPIRYIEEEKKLEDALESFSPFVTTFHNHAKDHLAGFNSDFTEVFKRALNNIFDDTAPKLLQGLKDHAKDIKLLSDEFSVTDEGIADSLGG